MATEFIVPGDVMRGLMAQLRYRGFDVEKAEAYEIPEQGMIVGSALASKDGQTGWVVVVFTRANNEVLVKSSTFGLDFTFEGEEDPAPSFDADFVDADKDLVEPEEMRYPITEAATAIDDPEGFWTQGKDLDEDGIQSINEAIRDGRATIIGKGSTHWLLSLGRGHVYLVEPVEKCGECRQPVWIDEISLLAPGVHSSCYNPADR